MPAGGRMGFVRFWICHRSSVPRGVRGHVTRPSKASVRQATSYGADGNCRAEMKTPPWQSQDGALKLGFQVCFSNQDPQARLRIRGGMLAGLDFKFVDDLLHVGHLLG